MYFCENCGKGPFPLRSSLNKHVRLSKKCNRAAQEKWGTFATKIWDHDAPGQPNQPPETPPILDENDLNDMLDIPPEDNLQELDDIIDFPRGSPPPTINAPGAGAMPAEPEHVRPTVEEAEGATAGDAYYIEEFPEHLGAGVVWGEELPFFEKLRQDQELNGSSRWGPFEDQDEWELATWLVRNTGQNQINSFLDLNIVKSHPFFDKQRLTDV